MKNKKKAINLHELLNIPSTLSEKFHHKTKVKKIESDSDPKTWPETWKKVHFKAYSRLKEIKLPKPKLLLSTFNFMKILMKRKSNRIFSKEPLSLKKLSSLLYFSAGMKNKEPPYLANRFYPSAGSRYPLEIYIISNKIKNLNKGLYHYYVRSNSLEKLLSFDLFKSYYNFGQKWISEAPCIILITAIFKRTTIKYGDRGYRHILIEAGHIGQNIYLTSTALGISCCAVGGYVDDQLNKLLDIDGLSESVVYVLAIG